MMWKRIRIPRKCPHPRCGRKTSVPCECIPEFILRMLGAAGDSEAWPRQFGKTNTIIQIMKIYCPCLEMSKAFEGKNGNFVIKIGKRVLLEFLQHP